MSTYLFQRLVAGLITVWATTVAVTLLIHAVPGDPVQIMYAQSQATTEAQLDEIRARLGLDQPIWRQYLMFMERLLQGDMGRTIRGDQPVFDLLIARLPNTLLLAACSLLIASTLGMTLGFLAAYRRGTWVDTTLMSAALIGVSIPHFWLGLMLMFLFVMHLAWLPVQAQDFRGVILPAVTLGLSNAAIIARLTRSSMIDIFSQDFMRTAWAKGLPKAVVLNRHALRAGLVPIVTMKGLLFTYMMGGAIVVENVFAWNGIGRVAIAAITQRDYPTIQGFILIFAFVVVVVSLIVDLLYALLDPRIRYR